MKLRLMDLNGRVDSALANPPVGMIDRSMELAATHGPMIGLCLTAATLIAAPVLSKGA